MFRGEIRVNSCDNRGQKVGESDHPQLSQIIIILDRKYHQSSERFMLIVVLLS